MFTLKIKWFDEDYYREFYYDYGEIKDAIREFNVFACVSDVEYASLEYSSKERSEI